jgi:hypothetical protein
MDGINRLQSSPPIKPTPFEAYEFLAIIRRDEILAALESVEVDLPKINYPQITEAKLTELNSLVATYEQQINQLQTQITEITKAYSAAFTDKNIDDCALQLEQSLVRCYLLIDKYEELINEMRMVIAAAGQDMPTFQAASEANYGQPSIEIYQKYVLPTVREKLIRAKNKHKDRTIKIDELAKILGINLDSTQGQEINNEKVGDELIVAIRKLIASEVKTVIDSVDYDPDTALTAEQLKTHFETALTAIKANDWSVQIVSEVASVSADQANITIKIPKDKTWKPARIKELIAHEIGTHVLRRVNADRLNVPLLAIGLAQYLSGEEAIATYCELALEPEINEQDIVGAIELYLATSLAYGLDREGKKRGIKELYPIILAYKNAITIKVNPDEIAKSALDVCLRVLRGSDLMGNAVFGKDLAYLSGRISLGQVLKENPNLADYAQIGKYDLANLRHIYALMVLSILPSNYTVGADVVSAEIGSSAVA